MKNIATFVTCTLLIFICSACNLGEKGHIDDNSWFSIWSNTHSYIVFYRPVEESGGFSYTIYDKEVEQKIIDKLSKDCFGTPSNPRKSIGELPAYCDGRTDLYIYNGVLAQNEYEMVAEYLTPDKVNHYFEDACEISKGCVLQDIIAETYYVFRFWGLSLTDKHRGKGMSWESTESLKDYQLKEFVQAVQSFQIKKAKEFRHKNANELEKLGIKLKE